MDDIKIIAYIEGHLNLEEKETIDKWIHASDENTFYYQKIKRVWKDTGSIDDFDKIDVKSKWLSTSKKMREIDLNKSKKSVFPFYKIAASIILILGLGFLYNNSLNTVKLVAESGKENKFELPDGSIVWLNQNSRLSYKKEFKVSSRDVKLEGEAYFVVAKNPDKPFIIEAGNTETKVLGTMFNLKEMDTMVELVLDEGSVEFSSEIDSDIIVPGEKILSNRAGKLIKSKNKNLNFSSWKTGVLIFEKTPLKNVLADIESFYHVKFDVRDKSFLECVLTSKFDNEKIDDVLETLKILYRIEYHKSESGIYIITKYSC